MPKPDSTASRTAPTERARALDEDRGLQSVSRPAEPNATLPGTNVSAGSWAQFQRRMQLRRETTCVSAMRRAMEAGDYETALDRANELVDIDPTWKEVALFLEQMRSASGPRATVPAGRQVTDSVPPPVTARATRRAAAAARPAPSVARPEPAIVRETLEPRRHRARRAVLAVVVAILAAAAIGWTLTTFLPPEVISYWVAQVRDRHVLSGILHPVAPASPAQPSPLAEVPELPFAGIVPPPGGNLAEIPSGNAHAPAGGAAAAPPVAGVRPPSAQAEKPTNTTGTTETTTSSDRNTTAPAGTTGTAQHPQPAPTPPVSEPASGRGAPASSSQPSVPAQPVAPPMSRETSAQAPPRGSAIPPSSETSARPRSGETNATPLSRESSSPPSLQRSNEAGGNAAASSSSAAPPPTPQTAPSQIAAGDNPASSRATSSGSQTTSLPERIVETPPVLQMPPVPALPATDTTRPPASATASPATGESAGAAGVKAPVTPPAPPAVDAEARDRGAIAQTIGAYAQGYTSLDAAAVRRIWPTVNEDALRNAFAQLDSQRVVFSGCMVAISELHANATCRGTATYVPKVGAQERMTGSHEWRFTLRKRVNVWVIDSASIR